MINETVVFELQIRSCMPNVNNFFVWFATGVARNLFKWSLRVNEDTLSWKSISALET